MKFKPLKKPSDIQAAFLVKAGTLREVQQIFKGLHVRLYL